MSRSNLILWAIVAAYMLFVFIKGVSKVRKVGSTDDFLVAGRNVGWFFLFCTMGATVIGGGYSIGAIGKTYEWGILMLLVSTGGYFHFIFSGLFVAPRFREAELYTVAGFFGHRYGEGPRFLMLVLSLLFSVFIVAAQMAAFGTVLASILPDFIDAANLTVWAILIGGAMVVIYSTAGGLIAVIHTDFYQFLVLMAGFLITLAFCVPDIIGSRNPETGRFVPTRFGTIDLVDADKLAYKINEGSDPVSRYLRERAVAEPPADVSGGRDPSIEGTIVDGLNRVLDDPGLYDEKRFAGVALGEQSLETLRGETEGAALRRRNLSLLQDAYPAELTKNRSIPADFFRIDGGKGLLFLITTFLAFFLGETFAPGYATRYCVGRSIRETKIGIAGVGFFLALTFPAVLFFIALYARIHFPDIDPQQALPMVVRELNNPVVAGIMIGALLMAVMSSADSALNSATAIFVKDLFEHQLGWEDRGDGRMLRTARLCTFGLGAVAILIAVLWSDIIGLLLFTYHVWAPAVILPVTLGVFSKKRSARQTRHITVTMAAATLSSLGYRTLTAGEGRAWWSLFPDRLSAVLGQIDPAVVGVLVSCAVYFTLAAADRERPAARERD
ncbi:MAG: sodium:solute symporter family protein [Candidatus Eisenbacteria bacterium]|nr:sodium:solute symporter family protein [Candidatus Eisenbacteria bacterium]